MLTGDNIHYLLQIRDTVPPLPERTVRVMLEALRWPPDDVERAILFLRMPPASPNAKPPAPISVEKVVDRPGDPKPVPVKQNPFPIGSPLIRGVRHHEEAHQRKSNHFLAGAILGFVVLVAGVLLYVGVGNITK